jgi:hypothetical protein
VRATKPAWLGEAESRARTWIIGHQLKEYLAEVSPRRLAEVERCVRTEHDRLIQRWGTVYCRREHPLLATRTRPGAESQ